MTTQTTCPETQPIELGVASTSTHELAALLGGARAAHKRWAKTKLATRLQIIRRIRHEITAQAESLIHSVDFPRRNGPAETIAGELIPLADACRFLERRASRLLAPQRQSNRWRPMWLFGVDVEVRREPLGTVLIIGAANYPLLLPGVQALQALAAGNSVLIKPGRGGSAAARALVATFHAAGIEKDLVQVLPEDESCVKELVECRVDKVVLTGSAETGCRVQAMLADKLIPATMELSGCDAVFVLPSADLDRVANCLAFGLVFNGGATCIAPRRVFVPEIHASELESRLTRFLGNLDTSQVLSERATRLIDEALQSGASLLGEPQSQRRSAVLTNATSHMRLLQTDLFEPVMSIVPVVSMDDALRADEHCPYALGAAVFGTNEPARRFAQRV